MDQRTISEAEREEIADFLSVDEDMLYSLIPPFLPEYQHALFSTPGQIQAGKAEIEKRKPAFREMLCHDWKLCQKLKDPTTSDALQIIAVVGDVIAASTSGIPPFLIGTILFKIGLREFCSCPNIG